MSPEPRIFHLITRLIDGGAVNALIPIATEMDEFNVTIGYGSEVDEHLVQTLHEHDVETKQFPLMRHYNPVTAVGAVGTIARYVQKQDFDIVHTHSTEAGIIGRIAANIADTPHVAHTIHGVPFAEDRNDALNWFVEKCEKAVAPRTDRIISIADVITAEYLERGIGRADQYRTIPYGIDLTAFEDVSPATDLPGDGTRVLMVSRLAEGKGFHVLFDAVERIDREDFSVLIAGDGPLRSELEDRIAERGMADRVHLLGYRNDIPRVMEASELLVLPSFREGTPLVIIEAMASGLPVVATDVAGIPEQVADGESGYLVPPGDPDSLAEQIERLLHDPKTREAFGQAGRERSSRFTTDRMVNQYNEVYKEATISKCLNTES